MDNENMLQVYTMEFCSVGENMKSRYFQGSDETELIILTAVTQAKKTNVTCSLFLWVLALNLWVLVCNQ